MTGLKFDLPALLALLGTNSTPGSDPAPHLPAVPEEVRYFAASIKKLNFRKDPEKWTAADWQLVGFFHDGSDSPVVSERTPIFLANDTMGRVLWLVAERLPGPRGLITPHWWRLGLAPLGKNAGLMMAIHHGFQAVLDTDRKRFQVRWWLESHPGGGGWPEAIDEAASVQVAAACVARALFEDATIRPLLDPRAGVSATLPAGNGTSPANRPVGPVGFLAKKLEWAQRAGILTFLVGQDTVLPPLPSPELKVQPVHTFDAAYQAILATDQLVQKYKQHVVQEWEQMWSDTNTHQEFIDASQRDSER